MPLENWRLTAVADALNAASTKKLTSASARLPDSSRVPSMIFTVMLPTRASWIEGIPEPRVDLLNRLDGIASNPPRNEMAQHMRPVDSW